MDTLTVSPDHGKAILMAWLELGPGKCCSPKYKEQSLQKILCSMKAQRPRKGMGCRKGIDGESMVIGHNCHEARAYCSDGHMNKAKTPLLGEGAFWRWFTVLMLKSPVQTLQKTSGSTDMDISSLTLIKIPSNLGPLKTTDICGHRTRKGESGHSKNAVCIKG